LREKNLMSEKLNFCMSEAIDQWNLTRERERETLPIKQCITHAIISSSSSPPYKNGATQSIIK
jgi:hypothetical protein